MKHQDCCEFESWGLEGKLNANKGSNQNCASAAFFFGFGKFPQIQGLYFLHTAVDKGWFWCWATVQLHPESAHVYLGYI